MINLAQLTETDLEEMARDIEEISKNNNQDDLFEIIGNALYDAGLTVTKTGHYATLQPDSMFSDSGGMSLKSAVNYFADPTPLSKNDAKKKGKGFWKHFEEQLKVTLCSNPYINEVLAGEGTLKDYLIVGIPLVLAALGLSWNPAALAIIASVFALIIKVGFKSYCAVKPV